VSITMSTEKKLEEIEAITNQTSDLLNRILELSQDADWEVRYQSIECIQQSGVLDSLKRVRQGLYDSKELVRVVCLEVLGEVQDERSVKDIKSLLNDASPLVRGAAALSLGKIGIGESIDDLLSRLQVEDDDEVKIPIYAALYTLGQDDYLENLLEGLNNEYYRVRCASANLLTDIANEHNNVKIVEALSLAFQREKTVAASSSIKNALAYINDQNKVRPIANTQ